MTAHDQQQRGAEVLAGLYEAAAVTALGLRGRDGEPGLWAAARVAAGDPGLDGAVREAAAAAADLPAGAERLAAARDLLAALDAHLALRPVLDPGVTAAWEVDADRARGADIALASGAWVPTPRERESAAALLAALRSDVCWPMAHRADAPPIARAGQIRALAAALTACPAPSGRVADIARAAYRELVSQRPDREVMHTVMSLPSVLAAVATGDVDL